MGAPYTCKWRTLSGHHSTSSYSCCCCWAEWIPQRKEGLRTANRVGKGGRAGSFTEGGCWVKGDYALGKDWIKSRLRLGFMSLYNPSLLLTPPRPHSFSPPFQLFNKRGFREGGLSHICVKQRGTQNWWQLSDTWSVLSTLVAADTNHLWLAILFRLVFIPAHSHSQGWKSAFLDQDYCVPFVF